MCDFRDGVVAIAILIIVVGRLFVKIEGRGPFFPHWE